MSCAEQGVAPDSTEKTATSLLTSATIAPLLVHLDYDPTVGCYTTNVEYASDGFGEGTTEISYEAVDCAGGSSAGQVGNQTSCTLAFPANPTNGQKFVATVGSCRPGGYYYWCAGGAWVSPPDYMYGTPPASPYSGLHYIYSYTNATGTIDYVYIANSGSGFLPDGWYVDVHNVTSTSCVSTPCSNCVNFGGIIRSNYLFTFYGSAAVSGSVTKVTAKPTSGSTVTTLTNFSLTYSTTDGVTFLIIGHAVAPNGITVSFNDYINAP